MGTLSCHEQRGVDRQQAPRLEPGGCPQGGARLSVSPPAWPPGGPPDPDPSSNSCTLSRRASGSQRPESLWPETGPGFCCAGVEEGLSPHLCPSVGGGRQGRGGPTFRCPGLPAALNAFPAPTPASLTKIASLLKVELKVTSSLEASRRHSSSLVSQGPFSVLPLGLAAQLGSPCLAVCTLAFTARGPGCDPKPSACPLSPPVSLTSAPPGGAGFPKPRRKVGAQGGGAAPRAAQPVVGGRAGFELRLGCQHRRPGGMGGLRQTPGSVGASGDRRQLEGSPLVGRGVC